MKPIAIVVCIGMIGGAVNAMQEESALPLDPQLIAQIKQEYPQFKEHKRTELKEVELAKKMSGIPFIGNMIKKLTNKITETIGAGITFDEVYAFLTRAFHLEEHMDYELNHIEDNPLNSAYLAQLIQNQKAQTEKEFIAYMREDRNRHPYMGTDYKAGNAQVMRDMSDDWFAEFAASQLACLIAHKIIRERNQ